MPIKSKIFFCLNVLVGISLLLLYLLYSKGKIDSFWARNWNDINRVLLLTFLASILYFFLKRVFKKDRIKWAAINLFLCTTLLIISHFVMSKWLLTLAEPEPEIPPTAIEMQQAAAIVYETWLSLQEKSPDQDNLRRLKELYDQDAETAVKIIGSKENSLKIFKRSDSDETVFGYYFNQVRDDRPSSSEKIPGNLVEAEKKPLFGSNTSNPNESYEIDTAKQIVIVKGEYVISNNDSSIYHTIAIEMQIAVKNKSKGKILRDIWKFILDTNYKSDFDEALRQREEKLKNEKENRP